MSACNLMRNAKQTVPALLASLGCLFKKKKKKPTTFVWCHNNTLPCVTLKNKKKLDQDAPTEGRV